MKKHHFTKQELRLIKYKLIKRGMSEDQAHKEVAGMMECVKNNYEVKEKRRKDQEKRNKQGGHRR